MRNASGLLAATIALTLPPIAAAQNLAWKSDGFSVQENLGQSVAFVGDLDGDGVPDVVAGAPAFPEFDAQGAYYFDTDPAWPLSTNPRAHFVSGADGHELRRIDGLRGSAFGVSVASAGDVDLDGVDDALIGAPLDGDGAVFVYSGASGAKLLEVRGTSSGSAFGAAVTGLGDVNGDGFPDFAAGAPFHVTLALLKVGRASIHSGKDGSQLAAFLGLKDGCRFGMRLANTGDVDADGTDDLAVATQDFGPNRNGRLEVYSGATFAKLHAIVLSSNGFVETNDWRVGQGGDVDGDGFSDLIVGRSDLGVLTGGGKSVSRVFSGASGALLYAPSFSPGAIGAVAVLGDVNQDGFGDFGVAGRGRPPWVFVQVFSGKDGSYYGGTPNSYGLIQSIASGADLDGDAIPDLVRGPWTPGTLPGRSGGLEAVSLATFTDLWVDDGESSNGLGRSIALHDDLDGDGFREILAGANGYARFLSGRTGATLREPRPTPLKTSTFGVVASLPDVDGDGVMDYAVGDPWADTPASFHPGRVEIRSGATDAILQTFDGKDTYESCGSVLAVGVQPTAAGGAAQLMLTAPYYLHHGRAEVLDAATGAQVFEIEGTVVNEWLGTLAAWVGDVDGDGVGDWAVEDAGFAFPAQQLWLISGVDGSTIRVFSRNAGAFVRDASIASGADFDGDGLADLVIGVPGDGFNSVGVVEIVSTLDGSTLLTIAADPADAIFGLSATLLGDVNGDAIVDVAVSAGEGVYPNFVGIVEVVSGKDGALLARIDGSGAGFETGPSILGGLPAWELFGSPTGSARVASGDDVDGDAIPDVVLGAPGEDDVDVDGGAVALHQLHELMLQIAPPSAPAGANVTAATRGGPANALAGLYAVDFSGTPLGFFVAFAALDAAGQWASSGAAPAGLAGDVLTLRSYAIGFGGNVVASGDATLTFE